MSHYYIQLPNGKITLFNNKHPLWGHLRGWPCTKAGKPRKTISDAEKVKLGCVPGTTDITGMVGGVAKTEGLMWWSAGHGIQAGIEATVETLKKTIADILKGVEDSGFDSWDVLYDHTDIFKFILKGVEDSETATNKKASLKYKIQYKSYLKLR